MKRYHAEDPFCSDDEDFEQAMAREVEGFDYFSDDSDFEHAMLRSLDREEQLGGALGPLFHFRMQPVGRRRRWRDTVDHTQFHAVLEQPREATPGDNLGVHLMEALYRAIRGQIANDARPHDLLHFAIHAHGFTHAFRSTNIQVEDFVNRGPYLDELLDTLAGKLNSNEEFHPDRGLQIDVVLVRQGSGRVTVEPYHREWVPLQTNWIEMVEIQLSTPGGELTYLSPGKTLVTVGLRQRL